jgi:UDP-N-acetylmuramoyl-tripeptide--D-alanyl-D-alanine ligase
MDLYRLYCEKPLVSTDTRRIVPGSIFFALKGASFDGNRFAKSALEAGARYAVVDDPSVAENDRYLVVDDVLETLQELARNHRRHLNCKVIAVAGSNGKTTTKELMHRVLSTTFKTFATAGNLNNHIGVPLTLLSIPGETELAIIEIGANHVGENKFLCEIALPDFGIVTNCGKDHLEGFGGIQGVIESNREVYAYLNAYNGKAFINTDDPMLMEIAGSVPGIGYGTRAGNFVRGSILEKFPFVRVRIQDTDISSCLFGSFQLYNILSAAAAGLYFGVSAEAIKSAVESYTPSNNRSQLIEWNGNRVLLDAYNANPSSMGEMIRDFSELPHAGKIAVLGDMFELGEDSENEHRAIVEQLKESSLRQTILVGAQFARHRGISGALHFESTGEAGEYIRQQGFRDCYFLVKGSRGMALEKIFA